MSSWQQFKYNILGSRWPEYLVARELEKKGWKVFRNFKVFDPTKKQYAEIDVLGVSSTGFVVVEVKSYQGDWLSRDHEERLGWQKTTMRRSVKSPVWQVKRARLALINSILRDYPAINEKVLSHFQTYVFLERGNVINWQDLQVQKAWTQMQVKVGPIGGRVSLPEAGPPCPEAFWSYLQSYHRHFRWRWYSRILHKHGFLKNYLEYLDRKWQKRNETVPRQVS